MLRLSRASGWVTPSCGTRTATNGAFGPAMSLSERREERLGKRSVVMRYGNRRTLRKWPLIRTFFSDYKAKQEALGQGEADAGSHLASADRRLIPVGIGGRKSSSSRSSLYGRKLWGETSITRSKGVSECKTWNLSYRRPAPGGTGRGWSWRSGGRLAPTGQLLRKPFAMSWISGSPALQRSCQWTAIIWTMRCGSSAVCWRARGLHRPSTQPHWRGNRRCCGGAGP